MPAQPVKKRTEEEVSQDDAQRYPLEWPLGWARTPYGRRQHARFGRRDRNTAGHRALKGLSVGDGLERLTGELRRLGAARVVISSNLRTRLDGLPYAQQAKSLDDPGVAVYFQLKRQSLVLACDRWRSVADNLAALAGHIEAIRAVDRYGVGTMEQAFSAYKALPADSAADWRTVLFGTDVPAPVTVDDVKDAYRERARLLHPDVGGSDGAMAHLNRARDYALAEMEA